MVKYEPHTTSGMVPLRGAALPTEQIALVRSSFAILASMADDVTAHFYRRLFDLNPALKPMFQHDVADQGRKFMTMLLVMARGLDELDRLLPDVQNLGRRHVAYGVLEAHYETLEEALLWALQHRLGEQWTPEVAAAWTAAYRMLARSMIAAAREVPEDAADIGLPYA